MKRHLLALALASAAVVSQAAGLENQLQKSSYAVGVDFGRTLAELNSEELSLIDFNAVVIGFRDAFNKQELKLSKEDMDKALEQLGKDVQETMQKKIEKLQSEVSEASKKFLEENGKKEGVKTTASGLQYVVKKEGEGKQATKDDSVKVMYEGRLIDGKVFDKSEKPVSFGVSQVIEGWVEGIQLMKEGAEYTFFIPSELAYGEFGQPSAGIMPGAALVFDVTLIEVEPKAENAPATEAAKTEEAVSNVSSEAVEAGKVEVVEVRDSKAEEKATEEKVAEEKPAEEKAAEEKVAEEKK